MHYMHLIIAHVSGLTLPRVSDIALSTSPFIFIQAMPEPEMGMTMPKLILKQIVVLRQSSVI